MDYLRRLFGSLWQVWSLPGKLDTILRNSEATLLHLRTIQEKESKLMALGQEILDAIAKETTVLDSFIALVEALVANNTIPTETANAIKAAVASNKAKLEAAIVANTPAAPPA